jgi:dipeptidyl aminopeptidase/acylaminoacyl peptidase
MAIVGWSYGGYAALQSAVHEPNLFKAVIAVAPVTDLEQLKNEAKLFGNYTNLKEFIGSGPHIRAGSPAQNADRIKVPVLMFHGDRDINVDIAQAKTMRGALKAAGKQVDLIEYEDLDHGLRQTEARIDMLTKSSTFLNQHLEN